MTFIYYMTSIGGVLGLWNNVSIYDFQLILIEIMAKLIDLQFMKKLSNFLKISKIYCFIRVFVTKMNLKVNILLKITFNEQIESFLGINHNFNVSYSDNTNNFLY
jgi:hypothetical protein